MPTVHGLSFTMDDEFRQRNRKHTEDERSRLGILIEMEGCKADALTVAQVGTQTLLADGYSTLAICTEKGIKPTAPRVIPFPDRQSVLEWIDRVQEGRRNLTAEDMEKRAAERRERVQAARSEGQSTRIIAEAEGVSHTQIRRDIEEIKSTGTPVPVEPTDGKIIGKDGKKRDATPTNGQLFCERCQRAGPVRDCVKCAELKAKTDRKHQASAKPSKPQKQGSEKFNWRDFDAHFGHVARATDALAKAYEGEKKSDEYKQCDHHLREFRKIWERWHKRLLKIKE